MGAYDIQPCCRGAILSLSECRRDLWMGIKQAERHGTSKYIDALPALKEAVKHEETELARHKERDHA